MTILGDVTRQKHTEVENLPFIQKLLNGQLTKDEYVFYLYELKYIYGALESLSKVIKLLDGLPDIERTQKIREDIEELHPGYTREILSSTREYLQYLNQLFSDSERRELLFAHVYVRHMGDLYGGKLIARTVPGEGRAYQFEDRPALIKEFGKKLHIGLADEANDAFDWFIKIFGEMGEKLNICQHTNS
jgi:heme oxygenase